MHCVIYPRRAGPLNSRERRAGTRASRPCQWHPGGNAHQRRGGSPHSLRPQDLADSGGNWRDSCRVPDCGVPARTRRNPTPAPTPTPTINAMVVALTARQETYCLVRDLAQSEAFAECMTARGFSREAVAGIEHSRVDTVAAFLGIEPQQPGSWLAPAEARNGHPASDRSARRTTPTARSTTPRTEDARGSRPRRTSRCGRRNRSRESARGDPVFGQYLAESAWLRQSRRSACCTNRTC